MLMVKAMVKAMVEGPSAGYLHGPDALQLM